MSPSDKQRIEGIILNYDRRFPDGDDSIALSVLDAQREYWELELMDKISSRTGVIKKSTSGRRWTISMPSMLYIILKKEYPTLFTTDIAWFKRNFKMFVVGK